MLVKPEDSLTKLAQVKQKCVWCSTWVESQNVYLWLLLLSVKSQTVSYYNENQNMQEMMA